MDAADETGLTALHLAALNGHALVAKLLISSKANVKCADAKGRTLVRHCPGLLSVCNIPRPPIGACLSGGE